MSLNTGDRLGPYEIVSKLGEGGMGEVYRARDAKLGRDVAIKRLPASVGADADRLMRFEREARTLAALNHPHIAGIFGVEGDALVMELVEGEDLAERLARGPIPIDDAMAIARQIAAALEAAHEAGIVHRDLKPANIKVRPDGTVKVLDFGLAKAMTPEGSGPLGSADGLTVTSPAMTGMGIILGTAAYMAPEQAKGRPVDRRADIWAFGVVFYEMLTGTRLFDAETVSEVLAAVLRADVDFGALPAGTPAHVRQLIARCLDRDPNTRLRDIGEARVALEHPDEPTPGSAAPAARPAGWNRLAAAVALTGLAAFVAGWLVRAPTQTADAQPGLMFKIDAAAEAFAVSPDGQALVYHSPQDAQLWVRRLDELEARPLVRLERIASIDTGGLFWAPDNRTVGYASDGALWKIDVEGGEPLQICRLENGAITGAAWGDNGRIVFGSWRGGLYEVSASGTSAPRLLVATTDTIEDFHNLYVLPNGAVAYWPHFITEDNEAIDILQPDGRTTRLPGVGSGPFSNGYLISRGSTMSSVWATPVDPDGERATGDAVQLLTGVRRFSASASGVLAYTTGTGERTQRSELVWLDADGGRVRATPIPGGMRRHQAVALSPSGTQIAAIVSERGEDAIVIIEAARGASVPLVAPDRVTRASPRWSADGRLLFFRESRGFVDYIRVVPVDGSRPPQDVVEGSYPALSPDGRRLIFTRDTRGRDSLWQVSLDGMQASDQPTLLRESTDSLEMPDLSPDGALVAFAQSVPFTGTNGEDATLILSRAADGSGQWPVSIDGGSRPTWVRPGGDLLYTKDNQLIIVPVTTGSEPSVGTPRTLMTIPADLRVRFGWDAPLPVVPGGRRVLALQVEPADTTTGIVIVQNWPKLLLKDRQ